MARIAGVDIPKKQKKLKKYTLIEMALDITEE